MPRLIRMLLVAGLAFLVACTFPVEQKHDVQDLPLIASWSADYPVAELDRLPPGQQQNPLGFIDNPATFANVWQAFIPGAALPVVDFSKQLVVFSRNVDFYNRTSIFKVTLTAGVIEILAMETMSAMPVEQKVVMAMAVVPRAGVKAVRLDRHITVPLD